MLLDIGRRTTVERILKLARSFEMDGRLIRATGWIRTSRFGKTVGFLELYDGSTQKTLQVVVPDTLASQYKADLGVGTAVRIEGAIRKSPEGASQSYELFAEEIDIIGSCDPSQYPLQKKRTSLEHLRTIGHLRSRSRLHQSIFRIRSRAGQLIHAYFAESGFHWLQSPILTASDAEGAGERFSVGPEGFFGKPMFLTVSGQLEAECFAQSHSDVYTFGPTFRAEDSHTPRHAAEFWMVEAEMAFATMQDAMELAEDLMSTVTRELLLDDVLVADFDYLEDLKTRVEEGPSLLDKLESILRYPGFAKISYRDAQTLLERSGETFEHPIGYGQPLQAEHEKCIAAHFSVPVFITHYPRSQKAFYMRLDERDETVEAFDLIVPGVGELVGGSAREERLDKLVEQMQHHGVPQDDLEWYLDLRRFGSTPHAGFGLGFERLIQWLTGTHHIRDVIAFPRVAGGAS